MAKEEFEIEIKKNGEVMIRTIGIKGESCLEAAKSLLALLDGKVIDQELTSDYYDNSIQNNVEDENQLYNRWG